jgi:hypothetical protein
MVILHGEAATATLWRPSVDFSSVWLRAPAGDRYIDRVSETLWPLTARVWQGHHVGSFDARYRVSVVCFSSNSAQRLYKRSTSS